jgi:hypothetical protein
MSKPPPGPMERAIAKRMGFTIPPPSSAAVNSTASNSAQGLIGLAAATAGSTKEGDDAIFNNDVADSINAEGCSINNTNNKTIMTRYDQLFEQRLADLQAYKEKHGHINVKRSEDKSLYEFCYNIRYARNNPEKYDRIINEERIASLDALGFDWTVTERGTKSFEKRIADLRNYKDKHGHVNVKKSENKSLYQFCCNIRHARNYPEKSNTVINDDRIASLDALGFDWSVSERQAGKSFEQRIADLRAYKDGHGHIRVKKSEDRSLYTFCRDMRQARNNPGKCTVALTNDRIASLDALGFEWNPDGKRNSTEELAFAQRIDDLRAYKEKNGHIKVKKSDDKSLYDFCVNIRHARNNPGKSTMIINDERIVSLDALGFDWSIIKERKVEKKRIPKMIPVLHKPHSQSQFIPVLHTPHSQSQNMVKKGSFQQQRIQDLRAYPGGDAARNILSHMNKDDCWSTNTSASRTAQLLRNHQQGKTEEEKEAALLLATWHTFGSSANPPVKQKSSVYNDNLHKRKSLSDGSIIDEEDSDEEIGAMIYASSKTARARRAAAEAEPVQINDSNQSSSYELVVRYAKERPQAISVIKKWRMLLRRKGV